MCTLLIPVYCYYLSFLHFSDPKALIGECNCKTSDPRGQVRTPLFGALKLFEVFNRKFS